MAAMQGLGNRVADSASRVGTTGDWSAQAEHVRNMTYRRLAAGQGGLRNAGEGGRRLRQLRDELT